MNSYPMPYVLITPARNEEAFIEKTIQSVIKQTVLPAKWVIVNDGSTDATSSIVRRYLADHPWMELVDLPVRRERNFAAKVYAFNAGQEKVKNLEYEVIGNLDADVSLDEDHFEFLLNEFEEGPAPWSCRDDFQGGRLQFGNRQFRRAEPRLRPVPNFSPRCFEEIGGYRPNKAGGIDWMAVTTARMMGWKTRSFREKSFFHHRTLGTAERGRFASSFSYGEKDYYLGGHPVWELFRVAYRMTKRPYLLDGIALGSGYLWAFLRRVETSCL